MKITLGIRELEVLRAFESAALDVCPFNEKTRVIEMTGTQVRDLIMDLFDWLSLSLDKEERFVLCNLGWRLTKNYI